MSNNLRSRLSPPNVWGLEASARKRDEKTFSRPQPGVWRLWMDDDNRWLPATCGRAVQALEMPASSNLARTGGRCRPGCAAASVFDYCIGMNRRIVGYHQDEEGDWIAELDCGHGQHVRHNPPWINRPWVTTAQGRESALGATLNCKKCDQGLPADRPGA